MSYRKDEIGSGYNEVALRGEHRPVKDLHTKEELLKILDSLKRAGVEAWWYSVSAKGSIPLFKSKILPHHSKAVEKDFYRWLVEEAHKRDIILFSWEYLSTAPLLMEQHPDWRMQFTECEKGRPERDRQFACYLSPYGDLLKEFCVEVVNDLGIDGIWFDGSFMRGTHRDKLGCICPRCQKRFKNDTGLTIPKRVDWSDKTFKEWIKWRYHFFGEYWKSLADYVRSKNKKALIVYNHFNRLNINAEGACPLQHLPMDALIAGEIDDQPYQTMLMIKYLRSVSNKYPPELWLNALDGTLPQYPSRPHPDPISLIFHGETCMTAGGFPSYGGSHPMFLEDTLKEIGDELKPRAPYVGGEPLLYAGIVLSSSTKDFAYPRDPYPTWKSIHGMHNILTHLHLPSEIILENQLTLADLKKFPVVILSDVQCLTVQAADALKGYVNHGGILLVTGLSGVKDEYGQEREQGILDALVGIRKRDTESGMLVIYPDSKILKENFPSCFAISGESRLVEVEEKVNILARGTVHKKSAGKWKTFDKETSLPAIVERRVGKGYIVFLCADIGGGYAVSPNRRSREIIRRLLIQHKKPEFTVDAPYNVAVTAWHQSGKLVFHLLNQPHTICKLPNDRSPLFPEDFPPCGPITIKLDKEIKRISSPISEEGLHLKTKSMNSSIILERLEMHNILDLEV